MTLGTFSLILALLTIGGYITGKKLDPMSCLWTGTGFLLIMAGALLLHFDLVAVIALGGCAYSFGAFLNPRITRGQ